MRLNVEFYQGLYNVPSAMINYSPGAKSIQLFGNSNLRPSDTCMYNQLPLIYYLLPRQQPGTTDSLYVNQTSYACYLYRAILTRVLRNFG